MKYLILLASVVIQICLGVFTHGAVSFPLSRRACI